MWLQVALAFLTLFTACNFIIPVTLFPHGTFVSVPLGSATFNCLPLSGSLKNVQWVVNGTDLEDLNLPNIAVSFNDIGRGIGVLEITEIPEHYHNTEFRCKANVTSDRSNTEEEYISANAILLLLQGKITHDILLSSFPPLTKP